MKIIEIASRIKGYHASRDKVTNFSLSHIESYSLGFHFAQTKDLAINAAIKAGKDKPQVYQYLLNINPLRIEGQPNGFPAFRVLESMFEHKQISIDQYNNYQDIYDETVEGGEIYDEAENANLLMRKVAKDLGYDSYSYINNFDSGLNILGTGTEVKPALSWIVLDPNQIRLATTMQ